MGRLFAALVVVLLLLGRTSARADDVLPRVVFPPGYGMPLQADGVVTVDTAWLQLELQPGWVVAAQRGTQFAIVAADPARQLIALRVQRGTMTLVGLQTNALAQLPIGSYGITPAGLDVNFRGASPAATGAPGEDTEPLAPGYRMSDAVMTQQQKYLDSLKVDIRDINSGLASIIRGLFPRRR
ncbi:MAG: hypothetical protein FD157_3812 [Rhodocyclaceae bacterium]|nr:MAG: hypothetical protein FD157_3812 [Rhodocyclaceae bacterium]TNC99729.1 MAG: hypothetical protein FD118_3615 [Rhodocyclaceae bacterium]